MTEQANDFSQYPHSIVNPNQHTKNTLSDTHKMRVLANISAEQVMVMLITTRY